MLTDWETAIVVVVVILSSILIGWWIDKRYNHGRIKGTVVTTFRKWRGSIVEDDIHSEVLTPVDTSLEVYHQHKPMIIRITNHVCVLPDVNTDKFDVTQFPFQNGTTLDSFMHVYDSLKDQNRDLYIIGEGICGWIAIRVAQYLKQHNENVRVISIHPPLLHNHLEFNYQFTNNSLESKSKLNKLFDRVDLNDTEHWHVYGGTLHQNQYKDIAKVFFTNSFDFFENDITKFVEEFNQKPAMN